MKASLFVKEMPDSVHGPMSKPRCASNEFSPESLFVLGRYANLIDALSGGIALGYWRRAWHGYPRLVSKAEQQLLLRMAPSERLEVDY